jgi:alpha-tubulin suppressor-like RCC1 family protein
MPGNRPHLLRRSRLIAVAFVLVAASSNCTHLRTADSDDPRAHHFTDVAVGETHTCGLAKNGTVHCWGFDNEFGQSDAPTGRFRQISAGLAHTCGVTVGEEIKCWGLGDGTQTPEPGPCESRVDYGQSQPPEGKFKFVSAGAVHTCALTPGGKAECWGSNERAQAFEPSGTFSDISAGPGHTCAVKSDGTILCWGEPLFDPNHDKQREIRHIKPSRGTFIEVEAGPRFSCGRKQSGRVECWGRLGDPENEEISSEPYRDMSVARMHICGIRLDGYVECWMEPIGESNPEIHKPRTGSFHQVSAFEYSA